LAALFGKHGAFLEESNGFWHDYTDGSSS
jgi:hypothetical protein